jgi:DNA-binding beta-propeller fold protein YncE
LLNHLPPEQLWPVEEILIRLAGDSTPAVSLGTTEDSRKATFTAWNKWLADHPKLDLAKLDQVPPMLGLTVVVQQKIRNVAGGRVGGEVLEIDKDKNKKWSFDVTNYPVDAHVFLDKGETRVLVAEFQASQVSLRNTKGDVIKAFNVGGNPISAQRLPNGNVFVVLQNRLAEYDSNGTEKFTFSRANHDIFRAKKLANGEIALITSAGQYLRIEAATQRVLKTFQVAPVPVLFGSMDVLPNGNVLAPDFQNNRVVEYNGEGKHVALFNVQWPNSAVRLPNGNTLIASQNTRKVMEFDRGGRVVWEYASDGMVFNAKRR